MSIAMLETVPSAFELESGGLARTSTFELPDVDDLRFLRSQKASGARHKDISFDPETGRLVGCRGTPEEADRMRTVLTEFSARATSWVRSMWPEYEGMVRDRVTLRPREEATRALRLTARNDLLHIDHFPTRASYGRRILRIGVNLGENDPIVWSTSLVFSELLAWFAKSNVIPQRSVAEWSKERQPIFRLLGGSPSGRSHYDSFMLRLHHAMKIDARLQDRSTRKIHAFRPGTTWAIFSDGVANAQLRGSFAIEHTFFVPMESLTNLPAAPVVQLANYRAAV